MSVLSDILDWSASRVEWQRDALRRIVTQGSLTKEDVDELCKLCLARRGIGAPGNLAPVAHTLAIEHLPTDRESANRVQLVGLREIHGVNALAADQQVSFQLDGLTIVFGHNGSGKSGYARILRSLCHARHRGERILQNVFTNGAQPTPSATVDYNVGGSTRSVTWLDCRDTPAELGQVAFFDADCAAIHVNQANELAFTPFGLDVLPKLAEVCGRLSESITASIREHERNVSPRLVDPQAPNGTQVRTMLDNLDKDSDIETFRRLAVLSGTESQRIVELREALSADPAVRARDLRNTAARLQRLIANVQRADDGLSGEVVAQIERKLQDVIATKTATRVAAEQAFGEQPLSGVGEDVWQRLWEAARNYSQVQAYPGQEFPFTGEDAVCVLCQQPLNVDARRRLTAFEKFIKADTQQAAERAEVVLGQMVNGIQNLTVGHNAFVEFLPDIPESQIAVRQSVRRFFCMAWKIRRKVLNSCKDFLWTTPCTLPISPLNQLNALMQTMASRAEELEQLATPNERLTLTHELNELLARQWLAGILHEVEAEIERKKVLAALSDALSDTVTTGITRKSTELADSYVTEVLRSRLTDEIKTLGAEYLRAEFDSPGGRLGQKRFKISLLGAQDDAEVRRVLSEGEFRCIALAGFLAELSTEQSGSAVIFDDPVCSLDNQWRRKVASRLAQLASERQVVVFTHDIVFLADLVGHCESQQIPLRQSYVYRGPDQPGLCIDGVPWAAMKVSSRLGCLKNMLQDARTIHRQQGPDAYEPPARRIYGLLRESWERAVEEVLLNSVVIRFDRAIHTQQLNKLSDITDTDIQTVNEGMIKCSRFLEGHDEAGASADPVPNPDELSQDISNLEIWVKQVRRRRS